MTGDRYPQLLRTEKHRWWKPVLGLLLAAAVMIVAGVGIVTAATLARVATGDDVSFGDDDTLTADHPIGLLANNLVLTVLIPACLLAVLIVHRSPIGDLFSVAGRLRWGLLARFALVSLTVVALFVGVPALLSSDAFDDAKVPATGTLIGLLVVIVCTTPLQAAGEEIAFRGYLTQSIASWFRAPVAGTVVAGLVSSSLFALAHGGQEPALFVDRFFFGVVAAWLVWRTGGLEASIGLHAANNLVLFLLTAATGSLQDEIESSSQAWPAAIFDMVMMSAYAVAATLLARRWQVDVRRPASLAALEGTAPVGYPDPRTSTSPPAGHEPPWGMG